MRGINQVHYIGALVGRPELKYTPAGLAILELTVAGRTPVTTEDGQLRTPAFYHRCKCFGTFAEAFAEAFEAGEVVSILGRLDYRSWETEACEQRAVVETVITGIHKLEGAFEIDYDNRNQPLLANALNQVTLVGNLTRDSQLRHTPGGDAVLTQRLAVNERYAGRAGKALEKVGYFTIEAWRSLAQAAQHGKKGEGLLVIGRLASDTWTDLDGKRRYVAKVEAERLYLVTRGREPGPLTEPPPRSTRGRKRSPSRDLDIDASEEAAF